MRSILLALLLSACDTAAEPYAVTREIYPTTVTIAVQEDGIDLDDDGFNDNRIGILLATFYVIGIDPGVDAQARIDSGALRQQLDVTSNGEVSAVPVDGVTFAFFDEVLTFELASPHVRVDSNAGSVIAGSIAGGVSRAEVFAKLPGPFARRLEALVASQCPARSVPGCGCAPIGDYDARYFLAELDASGDCTITEEEIVASELAADALFDDVTLAGKPLLSFALRFEAQRVE